MNGNQINAVLEAQNTREGWGEKDPADVGALLKGEGHPAFVEAAPADLPLAPAQLPAAVGGGHVPEGAERLAAEDFGTPLLKMKQPQTDADGVPDGHWFHDADLTQHGPAARFAILDIFPTRQWKSPHPSSDRDKKAKALSQAQAFGLAVDGEHKGPYCRSDDRAAPVASSVGTVAIDCRVCQVNAHDFLCRKGYTVDAFDLTDHGDGPAMTPVRIYVDGKSVKRMKNLNSTLTWAAKRQGKNLRDYCVEATTEKVDAYYVAKFAFKPIEDDSILSMLNAVSAK